MMKYIHIAFSIVLLLASCSKTYVSYEQPSEIMFVPVADGITKAAINSGLPEGQILAVWANYVTADPAFTTAQVGAPYLKSALFAEEADGIWAGSDYNYFWPKKGTLAFAGCSMPDSGNGEVGYDYAEDEITVSGFKQPANTAGTLDLMWFNKTDNSGAGFGAGTSSVAVVLDHALSWITVQVYGASASEAWTITDITLKDVVSEGSVTCGKTIGAVWDITDHDGTDENDSYPDMTIYNGEEVTVGSEPHTLESVPGGTIVIPQKPKVLSVTYRQNSDHLLTKEIDLSAEGTIEWEAGKHYTYTLFFNPYKIDFTVSMGGWDPEDQDPDPDEDIDVNI